MCQKKVLFTCIISVVVLLTWRRMQYKIWHNADLLLVTNFLIISHILIKSKKLSTESKKTLFAQGKKMKWRLIANVFVNVLSVRKQNPIRFRTSKRANATKFKLSNCLEILQDLNLLLKFSKASWSIRKSLCLYLNLSYSIRKQIDSRRLPNRFSKKGSATRLHFYCLLFLSSVLFPSEWQCCSIIII